MRSGARLRRTTLASLEQTAPHTTCSRSEGRLFSPTTIAVLAFSALFSPARSQSLNARVHPSIAFHCASSPTVLCGHSVLDFLSFPGAGMDLPMNRPCSPHSW
jgi:hypothetical protein